MGNDQWGLGLHFFSLTIFLAATTCTCLAAQNTTVACFEHERLALLKFKRSVIDASGMLSSWVGNDCCHWKGVRCVDVTRNVESLQLRGNFDNFDDLSRTRHLVSREMSPSLGELRHLKNLDLSGNRFHGTIPHHIGNLSNLKTLDLSSNGYLMVPDMAWFSGLSSLELLDLSYVSLSGAKNLDIVFYMIPSIKELRLSNCHLYDDDLGSLRNSSTTLLSNIQHLDLSGNSLSSLGRYPLTILANMTSLKVLNFSGNHLNSSVPIMPNLLELDLSKNDFKQWEDVGIWRQCHLKHLRVSSNGFLMELPDPPMNISECSHYAMEWLDLTSSLKGTIPKSFERIRSLQVVNLSSNSLTGSIPESLGRLGSLQTLDLSYNDLTVSVLESLGRLGSLQTLDLSHNKLTGSVPESLGRLGSLQTLGLSYNDLTGSVPESLGRLGSLQVFDLSYNMLTGSIPKSLGRLGSLQTLDLSYNDLTGSIPPFLGKLTKLDLSGNHLNGSIPKSFGRLEALTQLILKENQLTGPIPRSLGRLIVLETLAMASNLLTGTIPDSIGQLTNLRYLDVSSNYFEGVVSETHFANLSKLEYLYASNNNKLTFNLSREYWMPPFQLREIELSSCKIVSGFPQLVRNQRKLQFLALYNATISGPLPKWLRNIPTIPFLNLSYNNLSGPLTNLPSGKSRMHESTTLYLQNNFFGESIPWSLCKMEKLGILDISRNKLTGKIPNCLMNSQDLIYLVLSSNRLSGTIPSYTGACSTTLLKLALNDNNLSGELHQEFWNLTQLRVLDLGDNALCGKIPEWVGEKVRYLLLFRIHKNKFTGGIPRSLCMISDLQILDFAHNNLTGTIPHCLGKLSSMANRSLPIGTYILGDLLEGVVQVMKGVAMEYTTTLQFVFNIDLSSNKLEGKIPMELTTLHELVGLNLSNNHLSGGIPDNIGDMKSLISLDFSGNKLSGLIPPSIAALTSLSQLNLSNNNLSGRIPTGSQLQTFIDPSIYTGNKDLCGAPLPNNCSNHEVPIATSSENSEAIDEPNKIWFYLDITCGFATGFWGFIMVLVFKKEWRHKFFMFAEDTTDKIYVAVMIRVNKMKSGKKSHIDPLDCR